MVDISNPLASIVLRQGNPARWWRRRYYTLVSTKEIGDDWVLSPRSH